MLRLFTTSIKILWLFFAFKGSSSFTAKFGVLMKNISQSDCENESWKSQSEFSTDRVLPLFAFAHFLVFFPLRLSSSTTGKVFVTFKDVWKQISCVTQSQADVGALRLFNEFTRKKIFRCPLAQRQSLVTASKPNTCQNFLKMSVTMTLFSIAHSVTIYLYALEVLTKAVKPTPVFNTSWSLGGAYTRSQKQKSCIVIHSCAFTSKLCN